MIDLDRELRAMLDEHAGLAPPPVDAPRAIRVARRRQLGVVLTALAVVVAVAVASVAGVSALIRSSERTPADDTFSPGPLAAAPVGRYAFDGLTVASDGAVWWTGPGITRFDPASGSLRTFTVADDSAFGDVSVMVPAQEGGVWIPWGDGGFRRFDGERFRETLPPSPVFAIAEGPDGTVWGMGGEGVFRWEGASWVSVTSEGLPHNGERVGGAIAVDAGGGVWVSNPWGEPSRGFGVSRFDGTAWTTWTRSDGLPSDSVSTIVPGSNGDVWVGSGEGAARFRNGSWTAYPSAVTGIGGVLSIIAPIEAGVVVAGSGGFARFDGTTWSPVTSDLPRGRVRVAAGPSGVWAATGHGGGCCGRLFRLEGSRWEPQVPAKGPWFMGVSQIAAASSEEVWAKDTQGLWRLGGGTWTEYPGLPGGYVTEIAVAPDGVPWVSTDQGLARFDGSAWEQVESGTYDAIAFAPDGTVWTASRDDRRVGPVGGTALPALPDVGSRWGSMALAIGPQGDVWVGWEIGGYAIEGGGLAHFEGGDWQTVAPDPSVDWFAVHDLEVTPEGDVWVSGVGRPACEGCDWATVARLRNGGWTIFGESDGIPGGQLDVTPSGEVLLATSNGLFVFPDEAWHLLQEGNFGSLSVAPGGTVWLEGDGLFRLTDR